MPFMSRGCWKSSSPGCNPGSCPFQAVELIVAGVEGEEEKREEEEEENEEGEVEKKAVGQPSRSIHDHTTGRESARCEARDAKHETRGRQAGNRGLVRNRFRSRECKSEQQHARLRKEVQDDCCRRRAANGQAGWGRQ